MKQQTKCSRTRKKMIMQKTNKKKIKTGLVISKHDPVNKIKKKND